MTEEIRQSVAEHPSKVAPILSRSAKMIRAAAALGKNPPKIASNIKAI